MNTICLSCRHEYPYDPTSDLVGCPECGTEPPVVVELFDADDYLPEFYPEDYW